MSKYNLDNHVIKELGELIKEKRKEKGINVIDLAKSLDVNPGYISKLENGNNSKSINILLLKSIAKHLELNYIELLKKLGYLDKELLTLDINELKNLKNDWQNLKKNLKNPSEETIPFKGILEKIYDNNLTAYDTVDQVDIDSNYSDFMINNLYIKNKSVKGYFRRKEMIGEDNGNLFLIHTKNRTILCKLYQEKNMIIAISPLKEEIPKLYNKEEIKILAILYKTIEEKYY